MSAYNQIKVGPELISNSREAWLGYYVFTGLALVSLGGGYLWLRGSGFESAQYWLALIGILILFLVSLGIGIMCHLLGHLIDMVDEVRRGMSGSPKSTAVSGEKLDN